MALQAGNSDASSGMSKAIFDQLDATLMTPEDKDKLKAEDLEKVRNAWRKLAYCIATGIIDHLEANLEVVTVQTAGNVNAAVTGQTNAGGTLSHVHTVNLTAIQNNLVFTQNNDGTGHIE